MRNDLCQDNCSIITDSHCSDEYSTRDSKEEKFNLVKREIHQNRTGNRFKKKKIKIHIQIKSQYTNTNENFSSEFIVRNNTIHFEKPYFICPLGYIPRKNRCGMFFSIQFKILLNCSWITVQCPRGTYQFENKCKNCWFGFYNADYGRTSCLQCPLHLSTRKMRSKSITECRSK